MTIMPGGAYRYQSSQTRPRAPPASLSSLSSERQCLGMHAVRSFSSDQTADEPFRYLEIEEFKDSTTSYVTSHRIGFHGCV